MKKFLIILFVFGCLEASSASHFDVFKATFSACATQTDFKNSLDKEFTGFKIWRSSQSLTRSIDFGFTQAVYEVEISYGKSYGKEFRVYIVYAQNDSLVMGTLQELAGYDKVKESQVFRFDQQKIANYLNQHRKKYGADLSEKDFVKQLTVSVIYGFGCSEAGDFLPPEAKKMNRLVEKGSYEALSGWIRQINPETQAYGIIGLLELEEKGIRIETDEKEIIEALRQRNSNISNCMGCIYGVSSIQEILQWR